MFTSRFAVLVALALCASQAVSAPVYGVHGASVADCSAVNVNNVLNNAHVDVMPKRGLTDSHSATELHIHNNNKHNNIGVAHKRASAVSVAKGTNVDVNNVLNKPVVDVLKRGAVCKEGSWISVADGSNVDISNVLNGANVNVLSKGNGGAVSSPVDRPEADTPKPDVPKADTPKPDVPKADTPKPDVPKADAPKPDVPKADAPKPDAPKADAPKGDVPSSGNKGPGSSCN